MMSIGKKKEDLFFSQLTDMIFVEDEVVEADIIFVPGNRFPHMAERAAELFLGGWAPYIIPSGKYTIAKGVFEGAVPEAADKYPGPYRTEWEFLSDVLIQRGVPKERILREDQATYTWQNALFSRQATDAAGLSIRRALICCKAYHARRCLLYYQRAFPEAELSVIPAFPDGITRDNWRNSEESISAVMSELTRTVTQFSLLM